MIDFSWHRRAQDCIAQNALTNSKRPECFVFGQYPTHLQKGHGCHVTDIQGKRYIDFICGLGTNILGYGHPLIVDAAYRAMRDGLSLSLSSTSEILFAEELKGHFPFIDKVKILKSGTEAAMSALKIARAFNPDRPIVLSDGYHGHDPEFISLTPPALGCTARYSIDKFVDFEQLNKPQVGAVIIEPVVTNYYDDRRKYLNDLREICTKKGIVLIFDEIITGFRFPKFSVSGYFGIEPDLILLGKAIANGFPLSVVGGKKDIMEAGKEEGGYFVSSTFAGERASLEAARATMRELSTKGLIDSIWEKGRVFLERFNLIAPEIIRIEGYPTRGVLKASDMHLALFLQESARAGMLFGPSWFFSHAHIECIDQVISTCKDILGRIKLGEIKLMGQMPVKPFAQRVRNQ